MKRFVYFRSLMILIPLLLVVFTVSCRSSLEQQPQLIDKLPKTEPEEKHNPSLLEEVVESNSNEEENYDIFIPTMSTININLDDLFKADSIPEEQNMIVSVLKDNPSAELISTEPSAELISTEPSAETESEISVDNLTFSVQEEINPKTESLDKKENDSDNSRLIITIVILSIVVLAMYAFIFIDYSKRSAYKPIEIDESVLNDPFLESLLSSTTDVASKEKSKGTSTSKELQSEDEKQILNEIESTEEEK